jgi:class 3 adenylate cyclase/tetratricopeptide (TPR) repeat protein
MGAVWRAWDERLERWVALKQVRADVVVRQGRERLRREARAVARLNHPAIVHVYDILEEADGDWIVMELVEGRTLRRLLDEETALPPARALQLCREITEGLAEAHRQGILHRDLKASNVIVAPSGRAKILDFGLAKMMPREGGGKAPDPALSMPGLVLGTTFAMSPEQALGHDLDERSDLFSLGSLLYEMLTGKAPFQAENARLSLTLVVHAQVQPLRRSHPAIPPDLCDLVDWLLRKEPRERPASATEVLAALEAAAGSSGREAVPRARRPEQLYDSAAATFIEPPPLHPVDRLHGGSAHRQSGGERRTVTIACCSLVQLDRPAGEGRALAIELLSESLSEVMAAFETLAREVCQELSGSLGAVLNRMLWLCFGYPQAHEDDAERAVRAALALQERLAALPLSAAQRLAVRTGVHTGPAVVTARPGTDPALQPGDTFDIAMAIQSQVPAGRIGVSAASRQLLGKKFAAQPLPAVHLKDLDATIDVFELGPQVAPEHRESALSPSPLVNREAELQILLDRFRLAVSGTGQAVMIGGEAGIGKSRLVRALSERLAAEATWLVAHGSVFARNTPLSPLIHLLSRVLFAGGGSAEEGTAEEAGEKLRRLEEVLDEHGLQELEYAPLLGALLSLPVEGYPPLVLSPEARRKRTLAAVLAFLGALAERRPVVLVVEDLHWIDPSTLEFLDLLLGELIALPLLLVATFRPEFVAPWRHQTAVTQLSLGGLNEAHATALIAQIDASRRLPREAHREIVARTDGVPLFVEELTKAVLEAEAPLRGPQGVPFTLGAPLLARLDRLGDAKGVAQLAAVIGRTFSLELLEALSWIKGAALSSALGRLVQAEILYRRGPAPAVRYIFKHALIHDAAYLSLLASDRQQLHRQLAGLLQEEFPAVAEAEPELMAHHCERGGLTVEAVDYLLAAGLLAGERSAHVEAISHLSRGLDLLRGLPSTPELWGRELSLRSVLTASLEAVKGWGDPEVAANAERCAALCRELGEDASLIPALSSLWAYHLVRANRQPSIELADEIARLAETPAQVYMGHVAQGCAAYYEGRFAEALALAEQATSLFEPGLLPELAIFGDDAILLPYLIQAWALWILGEPEKAVRQQDAILAIVETLRSPFALGLALLSEIGLLRDLRVQDPEHLEGMAERLLKLAGEQELAFLYAAAHCAKGWAACQRGDLEGGTALLRTGLDLYAATGARPATEWSACLIEAQLAAGRLAEGLAATRETLAQSETLLDVSCDAELLRLEGELLRAAGDARAAETAFQRALGIARGQGARAFELRIATSLGHLLAEQGRAGEALPVLKAVYQTFREGFERRDLVEAREMLDRLASAAEIDLP